MDLNPILKSLHYAGSPNFVVGNSLDLDRVFGHIFGKPSRSAISGARTF